MLLLKSPVHAAGNPISDMQVTWNDLREGNSTNETELEGGGGGLGSPVRLNATSPLGRKEVRC